VSACGEDIVGDERFPAAAGPSVLRRSGRRYPFEQPWGPGWAGEAIDGIDSAVRRAGSRRRVGTTAALCGSLSEPASVAVSLLDDMGVSPDAVATEPETLTRKVHLA
jgi:hypothetical protein